MCGRYTLKTEPRLLAEQFALATIPALEARYNIAPTQDVPVVRTTADGRQLALLRWGLIPGWASDPSIGARMINARSETVAEKPAFRTAFKQRRCLVLADGFYEWQRSGGRKQPYFFQLRDGRPFAFAGLWERWQAPDGQTVETCTILTTAPNDLARPIHDRMPVILDPAAYDQWLDPELRLAGPLEALLQPYPAAAMTAYPVSTYVNNARNDGPQCLDPLV